MSQALLDRIESSSRVTIVGGGKAGVELAFTCARIKNVTLLYAKEILPDVSVHTRKHTERLLVRTRGHGRQTGVSCRRIGRAFIGCDGVVPVEWWTESGLSKPESFIEVDKYLRHHHFTNIYVTGDMAFCLNGGVDAVRSGRYVGKRLLEETNRPFRRRQSMNILLTTLGHALLTYGKFTWHGWIPYYMKRWIDSWYVRHYK